MAFLSWHARFSVGHPEIDQQHQRLFELVNHFDDVLKMGLQEELPLIVDDLLALSEAHFRFEERVIEASGFPRAVEHRRLHGELLDQVRTMRASLAVGGHLSHKALVRFLADWLTAHILREDMEYRSFLSQQA